jgi:hypothetical protein
MTFLQRVLKAQAFVWFVAAIGFGLVPRWLVETVMSQAPEPEYVWVRAGAIMGLVLAMFMVLVAQRIGDVWWWSWAFAVVSAGLATLCIVTAAFGVPVGSATWPWWALGLGHLVLGALDLWGLSLAGQEKPVV